jgi:DNA invertase Pin-like site-specific DNA recombinase
MQERSIPDQQAYVEKWAQEHGYEIKRWFVDDAISGTGVKDREAFVKMIAAAENGKDFDAVLCYDISRFSRGGANETGYYVHRLKLAGVSSVFCADGLPEGDEGELIQSMKSWQARQYSVKLSRDSIRGQLSNIMTRHSAPGGTPAFGYDKQHLSADGRPLRTFRWLSDGRKEEYDASGRLVRVLPPGETVRKAKSDFVRLIPSTADRVAIIKLIYDQMTAGYGGRYIAAKLNQDGVPSGDGKMWTSGQVRRLAANPVYRGSLVWNRRTEAKLHSIGRDGQLEPRQGTYTTRQNPQDAWVVIDSVHEPLVSGEQFEKVQQLIGARRLANGAAKTGNRALLSGLVVCRRCGWRYGQTYLKSPSAEGPQRRRHYSCRGYHGGGSAVCMSTRIPADALDEWVIGHVRRAMLGDCDGAQAVIESFIRQALQAQEKPADTAAAERDLEAVAKRIQAMMSMLLDPEFEGLEELKTTLATLKARRDGLLKVLEGSRKANLIVDESELREWAGKQLGQLDRLLTREASIIEARSLVHNAVDRIDIYPDNKCGDLFIVSDLNAFFMRRPSTMGALPDSLAPG